MMQAIEKRIIEIVNLVLPDCSITVDNLNDDLCELGMDSILFIQIVVALEEEFECEIPDEKLLIIEMDTVQKIVDVLQSIYDNQDSNT